ncbi:MAG TPA: transglycosylase domain-containing protein [Acidimicrobiia bacterium]|nr:transglycosylase domain-containing protein [Acidimicrobiia bacterium]
MAGVVTGLSLVALVPGTRQIGRSVQYRETTAGLGQLSAPTTVYDSRGDAIGKIGLQDREPAELAEVPQSLIDAVVVTEDRSFWRNPGVDAGGMARAFVQNLTKGRVSEGGSTITQQLVKNRLTGARRDVSRKVKELVLAFRVNEKYSKREILKQYLNTVYFGEGSYGVKSAARRFFLTTDPGSPAPRPKRLEELTIGETALLAGMIHNPEGDNLFEHPHRARMRRDEVLESMVSARKITRAQADMASREPLPTAKPAAVDLTPSNAWVEHAQSVLLKDRRLGANVGERRKKVLQGGLQVYTTLDPPVQQMADQAVANGLAGARPGFGTALVAMDPTNGSVKAMTDSRPFSQSKFNIAVDGAGRQIGSSFKVVALAAMLQNGYSRNDRVDGSGPCSVPGFEGNTTNVESGGGVVTVQDATAESVNCAYVRLSTSIGMEKVVQMAEQMGVRSDVTGRQPAAQWARALTFPLGVVSVTPVEMATVGATIASGGVHHDPVFVSKVVGPDGKTVFDDSHRSGNRVLDPQVAACTASVLHGPIDEPIGTASGKGIPGHDAFGKTGTTDQKTSATFLGGTPDLVSYVWHGNPDADVPGAGFGGDRPASIWNDFMKRALGSQPDDPFPTPGPACDAPGKFIDPILGRTTDVPAPAAPPPGSTSPPVPGSQAPPTSRAPLPAPLPVPPPPSTRPPVTVPQPSLPAAGPGVDGGNG